MERKSLNVVRVSPRRKVLCFVNNTNSDQPDLNLYILQSTNKFPFKLLVSCEDCDQTDQMHRLSFQIGCFSPFIEVGESQS